MFKHNNCLTKRGNVKNALMKRPKLKGTYKIIIIKKKKGQKVTASR
jgi:hypothetical protein